MARKYWEYGVAVAAGLAYGLGLRLTMFSHTRHTSWWYPTELWVMTAGFLIFAPLAMGWIAIAALQKDDRMRWGTWITLPWLAVLLSHACVLAAGVEGFICVVFALPITMVASSIGGVTAGLVLRKRFLQRGPATLCLAILPLVMAGVEMQFAGPLEVRTVETTIRIHAPAEAVWRNIERVPAISPKELRPTWAHRIGFPLPVEATLDREGVGGVRHASFEHGLLFIETITDWETDWRIRFTIAADTEHIPQTTLDEHVTIGGRFFDVLDGEYRLEPLAGGDIVLHLSSRERLSTDFNRYAAVWSDAVMRDLQGSILEVVKRRSERGGA